MRVSCLKDPSSDPNEIQVHVEVSEINYPPDFKYSHSFKYKVPSSTDANGKIYGEIIVYANKQDAASGDVNDTSSSFELERCCDKDCKEKNPEGCPVIAGKINRLLVADVFHTKPKPHALREFGAALFKGLFSNLSGQLLQKHSNGGIYLELNDNCDLDAIPWEYAIDRATFLAHQCIFVRVQNCDRSSDLLSNHPLRIVAVAPDPINTDLADLHLSEQFRNFINGFTRTRKAVKLERVFPPTVSRMDELLMKERETATVLHFMGHCGMNVLDGPRALIFEHNDNGRQEYIDTSRLITTPDNLRLAFLSACDSRDIARVLAERGVPYTIGSNCPLPDDVARKFESEFYKFLTNGSTVEMAMHQARVSIQSSNDIRSSDYFAGAMVLYLSAFRKDEGSFKCPDGEPEINFNWPPHNLTELNTTSTFRGRKKDLDKLYVDLKDMVDHGTQVPHIYIIKGIGGQELAVEAMWRMGHLFPGGIFAWKFDSERVTSIMGYFRHLVEVIFSEEKWLQIEKHNSNVQELGAAIIENLQNRSTCLLIFDYADILDLGEKEGNVHAVELRRWLKKIESVRDSVKILLISEKSLASWNGERGGMQLDIHSEQYKIIENSKKGVYKYFASNDNVKSMVAAQAVFCVDHKLIPHFVKRPKIFQKLEHVVEMSNEEPKLVTLCGLGGMGKSQIALDFCYQNKDFYQYIFWMEADTEATLQSSFKAAASKINSLANNTSENVVPCMIEWFQKNSGWLIIFDNADDYSFSNTSNRHLQYKYFPKSGQGVILMTTRLKYEENSTIDLDEIEMDDDTALNLLFQKDADRYRGDENALTIIKELGYLPLALDLAGATMRMERCTPLKYLENYKKSTKQYLDPKYVLDRTGSKHGKTVLTLWDVSFQKIRDKNELAASLLQFIALLYPDNISLALFKNHAAVILKLKETLSDYDLATAVRILADYSLVRYTTREGDTIKDTLAIHRLVQQVILLGAESEELERLEKSKRLLSALSSELKLKDENSSKIIGMYIPHIRHLIEQIIPLAINEYDIVQFSKWVANQPDFSKELVSLLSPTIIYLTSRHLFEGVGNLAMLAIFLSKAIDVVHPDTATALSNLSYFYTSQQQFQYAERPCMLAWKIRRKVLGHSHKDTISIVHDLAYIYTNLGKEKLATHIYWEAATVGDREAQQQLSYRYQGRLAEYWRNQSEQSSPYSEENVRKDFTPLHKAVVEDDIQEISNNITKFKEFANIKDRNGQTPLHLALKNGNNTVAEILMKKEFGVDPTIEDSYGQISLHLAAKSGSLEVVKLLVNDFNIDVNVTDKDGQQPLHLAVIGHNTEVAQMLLDEFKADPSIQTKMFKTALQLAVETELFEFIAFALQKTDLTQLDLSDSSMKVEGARTLAEFLKQNTTLTQLNLEKNDIGAEGTRALAESLKQNMTLTQMNLENNKIGAEGTRALAESLKQNMTLTQLNLKNNGIGAEGTRALAESLKQNTTLTQLNLEHNAIGAEGTRALAESLKQNTTLTQLNLSLNDIGAEGTRALAESLKQNTALTQLNLSYNETGAEGTRALAESLKQNTTLTQLNLENNKIGAEGTHALAESLKQNTTLTQLNLYNNKIGAEGTHALAESLKQNTTLSQLNLERNDIGDNGACALAESLKQNMALTQLNFKNNNISSEGTHALAEFLKRNTILTQLNLEDTHFSTKVTDALAKSLKQNAWPHVEYMLKFSA